MRTLLRSKAKLLVLALGVLLAVPAIALADNIIDDLDGAATTQTIAAGGTFTNHYWIVANGGGGDTGNNDPQAGCNASDANPVHVTIDAPPEVTVAYPNNGTDMTFTKCKDGSTNNSQAVTFSSSTPGTYTITANASGSGDYNTNPAEFTLVVTGGGSGNVAPTADAGGPYEFDEGSATNQLNGSGTDTDGTVASYAWDLNYDGTNFTVDSTLQNPNFDATNIDGPATRTVALKVTDDDGAQSAIDTESVTIRNVAPTTSNNTFVVNSILGTVTAGLDFSDVGYLDTHGPDLSYFTWSDVGNRYAAVTEEHVAPNATGHASDTRTLNPGCYNLGVTGTAVDDDGGASAPLTIQSSTQQTSIYSKAFRPPIVDNERNIAKYGNVVPVKVQLTNPCTGTTVTNAALYITFAKGLNGEFIEDNNPVAESVSAADNGQQMRVADGGYIYNLSTKSLSQNTDWAVRVRLGATDGPIILQAVLYPKK